jgi:uncharacterized membrane protein
MPGASLADTIGPVDVAVVAFDGNQFNGDVAPAIAQLQAAGTVRIIDLTFVSKETNGTISIDEVEDAAIAGAFQQLTDSPLELLSDEDLAIIADDLRPGSSAMVVVWENSWAARLASSLRESHGQVVSLERIPREVVVTAIEALGQEEKS